MNGAARLAAALLPLPALLAVVAACGSPSSGRPAASLWTEHCQRCHGPDGHGIGALRALEPRVNLTTSAMVRDGAKGLIFQRIAYGYATMPGFAHKLERGDIEALVEFTVAFGGR